MYINCLSIISTQSNYYCLFCYVSVYSVWQTVYIKGTDLHSDIAVPLFYNISVIGPLETTQCNGHHICYTETFDAFHILGMIINNYN